MNNEAGLLQRKPSCTYVIISSPKSEHSLDLSWPSEIVLLNVVSVLHAQIKKNWVEFVVTSKKISKAHYLLCDTLRLLCLDIPSWSSFANENYARCAVYTVQYTLV